MITSLLKIKVPPEKQRDAIQTVRTVSGWTRAQPGCISIEFYQDIHDPLIMLLLEEWEDWESIENHIQSDIYRNILELVELSCELPEIKFCSDSDTKGMEVIERLRR